MGIGSEQMCLKRRDKNSQQICENKCLTLQSSEKRKSKPHYHYSPVRKAIAEKSAITRVNEKGNSLLVGMEINHFEKY